MVAPILSTSADHLLEVLDLGTVVRLHQRELGLAADARQRGAQLVGELGGEQLLAAQCAGDAVQQEVEGARQVGDLVAGARVLEAGVQGSLAPVVGQRGHVLDRREGASHRPGRDPGGAGRDDQPEQDETDDDLGAGLLVGLQAPRDHQHARAGRGPADLHRRRQEDALVAHDARAAVAPDRARRRPPGCVASPAARSASRRPGRRARWCRRSSRPASRAPLRVRWPSSRSRTR